MTRLKRNATAPSKGDGVTSTTHIMNEQPTGVATPTDTAPVLTGELKIVLTDRQTKNFWNKVNKNGPVPEHKPELGPCWIWTAFIDRDGYGMVRLFGRNYRPHRVSYLMHVGPIPTGMLTCHACDVRSCLNPQHLFLGTEQENTTDMVNKGRHKGEKPGEAHHNAKITEEIVLAIRSRFAAGSIMQKELAKEYGIGNMQVSRIIRGKRWKHLAIKSPTISGEAGDIKNT